MFSSIMNIIGCTTAYLLYRDYCNRSMFQKDLECNKFPIMQGILSINKSDQTEGGDRPNVPSIHPFHMIDIHTHKNICTRYSGMTPRSGYQYYINNLWYRKNICNYAIPKIKINDVDVNLKDAHVNYTHYQVQRIGSNQFISEYYIPENTLISTFGSQIDDQYHVKFIGSYNSVIDDIAHCYYGVNDYSTLATIGVFGIYLLWVIHQL